MKNIVKISPVDPEIWLKLKKNKLRKVKHIARLASVLSRLNNITNDYVADIGMRNWRSHRTALVSADDSGDGSQSKPGEPLYTGRIPCNGRWSER